MKSQRIRLHFTLGEGGSYKSVSLYTHGKTLLAVKTRKKIAHKTKLGEKCCFHGKKKKKFRTNLKGKKNPKPNQHQLI